MRTISRPIAGFAFVLAILLALLSAGEAALAYDLRTETATTRDGLTLVFKRYRNQGGVPVILAHGFGTNHAEFDLPSRSFARFLADRGYDVWIANFRGCGSNGYESDRAIGYSFDEVMALDAPALVEKVRAATGGARPFWVGHSMGGMVAYAYLQGATFRSVRTHSVPVLTLAGVRWVDVYGTRVVADAATARQRNAGLRGLVTIGSPAAMQWRVRATPADFWRHSYWDYNLLLRALSFSPTANAAAHATPIVYVGELIAFLDTYLPLVPYVGSDVRAFLAAVAAQVATTPLASEVGYGPNLDPAVLQDGIGLAAEDYSTVVIRQLMDGIRRESARERHVLDTARAPYVYSDHMGEIALPALLVAGDKDKLACDDKIRDRGFAPLGSADKTFLGVAGFGHIDLVIGNAAEARVWTPVEAWLAGH